MSDTDLVSIVESMIGMVRNERVASYNEGVDTERERCVRLVESYMCSTGNLAALAEQIRHPEDVDGEQVGRTELRAENERLRAALEPFQRNVDALSLSATLGHIDREMLWNARHAYEQKASE